jgi:O-antigen/teichoic acid export membrane protein
MGYLKQSIEGVAWVAGLRYVSRIAVLAKSFILARFFLNPYQFGLFGIASIVLVLLEVLTETGINVFLIQRKDAIREYINDAWLISIFRGIGIGFFIFVSIPLIEYFFNNSDVGNLLFLVTFIPIVRGFINPAIVTYQKDLQFKTEFFFRFSLLTIEIGVTLVLAYFQFGAESLIWGQLVSAVVEVIFSFLLIKPIPQLVFHREKIVEILHQGKWVTTTGIFTYFTQEGDDVVVGKMLGIAPIGYYQMAYKLSTLPITEVTDVIHRVAFPVYSALADDKYRLIRAYKKAVSFITVTACVLGLILFLFADSIVITLLGEQWAVIIPLLRIMIVYGVFRAISDSTNALFFSVNKQHYTTVRSFLRFVILALLIIPFIHVFGLVGAAYASVLSLLVELPLTLYYVRKIMQA